MFTALIECFRRACSLVWFVKPDEVRKSSVVERQLARGRRAVWLTVCFVGTADFFFLGISGTT